jgi:hypothetical protein
VAALLGLIGLVTTLAMVMHVLFRGIDLQVTSDPTEMGSR